MSEQTKTPRNQRETAELIARTFETAASQVRGCMEHGQTVEQAIYSLELRAMSARVLAR